MKHSAPPPSFIPDDAWRRRQRAAFEHMLADLDNFERRQQAEARATANAMIPHLVPCTRTGHCRSRTPRTRRTRPTKTSTDGEPSSAAHAHGGAL